MAATTPTRIKGTSITQPTGDPKNHQIVCNQLKETTEIAQRQRGDPNDSFVRVSEFCNITGAELVNGTLQPSSTTAKLYGASTVASLPAAPGTGSRATALDASSPVFGAAVSGGGSSVCPVFFNGSTWVVG